MIDFTTIAPCLTMASSAPLSLDYFPCYIGGNYSAIFILIVHTESDHRSLLLINELGILT